MIVKSKWSPLIISKGHHQSRLGPVCVHHETWLFPFKPFEPSVPFFVFLCIKELSSLWNSSMVSLKLIICHNWKPDQPLRKWNLVFAHIFFAQIIDHSLSRVDITVTDCLAELTHWSWPVNLKWFLTVVISPIHFYPPKRSTEYLTSHSATKQ